MLKIQCFLFEKKVSGLFEGVSHADANLEFTVKVAYIEIYMERIRDLLDRFRTKVNLSVREDPREGVYVAGVTEE
jgi:kinesin family member 5